MNVRICELSALGAGFGSQDLLAKTCFNNACVDWVEAAQGCSCCAHFGPAMDGYVSHVLTGAPRAQRLLAPRFSVGKACRANENRSPVGTA